MSNVHVHHCLFPWFLYFTHEVLQIYLRRGNEFLLAWIPNLPDVYGKYPWLKVGHISLIGFFSLESLNINIWLSFCCSPIKYKMNALTKKWRWQLRHIVCHMKPSPSSKYVWCILVRGLVGGRVYDVYWLVGVYWCMMYILARVMHIGPFQWSRAVLSGLMVTSHFILWGSRRVGNRNHKLSSPQSSPGKTENSQIGTNFNI